MHQSCGVGAKSEAVLPWRVPVWQQGPPHSILIVIKGRGTGLALCKCGMASWELRWSWNGGPTDLSRTQLGYRLCCVRPFWLVAHSPWLNQGCHRRSVQPWNLLLDLEGKSCTLTKPMALYEYGQRSIQGQRAAAVS